MAPARESTATARAGAPAEGRVLRARGRKTVRKLLDAAEEVLAERGFHAVRVDDIVQAAETSHGTFYLYFSNKEDLFRALVLDVADSMGELAESLGELTPDDAGRAELHRWMTEFVELYRTKSAVVRSWVEAELDQHEFGQIGAETLGAFAGVLTRRIRESSAAVHDPALAAIIIVAMIERCVYYKSVGQIRASRAALVDELTRAIHAALFPAAA